MGWFIGTFFFYWWHVLRHRDGFWLMFHQLHHSPSRIELLTSFYKHPLEILSDARLSALVLYPLLGCSLMDFADRCGFPNGAEEKLAAMFAFKDVYYREPL